MEARAYWLQTMLKIADPVLKNLAAGTLKQNMPMVFHPDRAEYMLSLIHISEPTRPY